MHGSFGQALRGAAALTGLMLSGLQGCGGTHAGAPAAAGPARPDSVVLSDSQLRAVKLVPTSTRAFALLRSAVGSIDFDQDRMVQAGVADLTAAALSRAKSLYDTEGMAQKDYQQAVSDQMTAEGALKGAREAMKTACRRGQYGYNSTL